MVFGFGRGRVELHPVVRAIAEVALQALADDATGGLNAGRLLVANRGHEGFAVDGGAEGVTPGAAFVDARERPRLEVEPDPERDPERDQRKLTPELRVARVTDRRNRREALTPEADQAEDPGFVLRDLGQGVGHHLDMHVSQGACLASVPCGHGFEVHALPGRPRRQAKRPAADQRIRLREPGVLARRRDDLLIDGPERPEANLGQEVARSLAEGDVQRVVVGFGQSAHLGRLARGHLLVARDHGEEARVVALLARGAVPAVDEVAGRDRVSVGEPAVGPDVKRVGKAFRRHDGLAGRQVGHLSQLLVELVEP